LSRYELFIECRPCREAKHRECAGRRRCNEDVIENNMVNIRCTCEYCKLRHKNSSVETAVGEKFVQIDKIGSLKVEKNATSRKLGIAG
jgi:hypothetical protein